MFITPCLMKLTMQLILDLFGDDRVHINMKEVQKKSGTDDCGLFAIAFSFSQARKVDPANLRSSFAQSVMRSHFINCLQEEKFSQFPTKSGDCSPSAPQRRYTYMIMIIKMIEIYNIAAQPYYWW